MMRKYLKVSTLFLALLFACAISVHAGGEAMTLSVVLSGIVEQPDGSEETIPLEGAFRISQGSIEIGEIQAGGETIALSGTDAVLVEPLAETIDPMWDISDADQIIMMTDGHVTVPVILHLRSGAKAAQEAELDYEADSETEESETGESETENAGGKSEDGEFLTEEDETSGGETASAAYRNDLPTAIPSESATPEPAIAELNESAAEVWVTAFMDGNNNGEFAANESGYPGVRFYLLSESGDAVSSGESGRDGLVILRAPEAGTYSIRAALPEGLIFGKKGNKTAGNFSCMGMSAEGVQDSETFELKTGDVLEKSVGIQTGLTVSGTCWLDENGDGVMGSGEPKLAGVRLTMIGQKNGLEFETYTDENGVWSFDRIRAGFYDFTSYAPDGMMFTRYSKTGGRNRSIFTTEGKTKITKTLDTNDGKSVSDQNIGFTWSAGVSGMCFLDANYNGMYDEGELPLANVKVTAIKQVKDEEVAVAYSGEDGRYSLSGLRGNTFKIRAVLPDDGSTFTAAVSDPLGNHFKSRDGRRENFWNDFVIEDGKQYQVNIGAIYYGSVGGTVYLDDNFSAEQDRNEKTASGIAITLLDESGTVVDSKTSSAKGTYSFTGLVPGNYSLRMTARAGYAFTKAGEGNVMLNLTGGEGYSESFFVPLGQDVTGMDAGMIKPGKVSGKVFADRNDNGMQDADEGGLSGTVVRLMGEEGEAFMAVIGADGNFLFDAVMPGEYRLRYELPESGVFAGMQAGGNTVSGENGIGTSEEFSISSAGEYQAPLCGALTLGRINGEVYRDHDGSGERTEGEEALAGAEIILTPSREDLEPIKAVTGDDGSFALSDLRPDTYSLTLNMPEGLVLSRPGSVTLPLETGKGEQTASLRLDMGSRWEGQKLGAVIPAKISGRIWLDENNNGIREKGEATPTGLAVTLTDEGNGQIYATLYTDKNGRFISEGMVPGSFSISYTLDSNTESSLPGDNTFRQAGDRLIMDGIALNEGDSREDPLLGIVKYTEMGGNVWIDRSGTVESLEGASVSLENAEGAAIQTAVTGVDGSYHFTGLMPGEYVIRAALPEGCVACEPDDERLTTGLISVLKDTDGREGATDPITLKMGEDQLRLDIGSVLPGTIGDYCWLDDNGNGWQDGSEYGIPGVKIELQRNGVTVAETVSDAYGLYWFREVYPAVYTLKVTPPAEVKPTQKRNDVYLIVSSLNETEDAVCGTDPIAVQSDTVDFNIDLGFACRTPGVYPAGIGEAPTMNWNQTYTPKN